MADARPQSRSAEVRAAEKVLRLAHFADARLPVLPKLGQRRRRGDPLDLLLQRCTKRPLLQADVEASDLSTDKWIAESLWDGRFPPSHERHPWHSEFSKAREEELWDAPAAVDYRAERAAAKRRNP